jgi:hypothetical protein
MAYAIEQRRFPHAGFAVHPQRAPRPRGSARDQLIQACALGVAAYQSGPRRSRPAGERLPLHRPIFGVAAPLKGYKLLIRAPHLDAGAFPEGEKPSFWLRVDATAPGHTAAGVRLPVGFPLARMR